MFAWFVAAVIDSPKFGSLSFWVPLTECVAMRIDAFFGAGAFFVAASAAENGVELVFFD